MKWVFSHINLLLYLTSHFTELTLIFSYLLKVHPCIIELCVDYFQVTGTLHPAWAAAGGEGEEGGCGGAGCGKEGGGHAAGAEGGPGEGRGWVRSPLHGGRHPQERRSLCCEECHDSFLCALETV